MSATNTNPSSKLVWFGNEFPSEDLKVLFRRLHQHTKDRRFPFLSSFIDNCTAVVKQEAARLPQDKQNLIPYFETVLTLAEHGDFRQGPLGAAMESVFLCILEVGMLLGHYEALGPEYDLRPDATTLAGLSIGLLAGAAVAVSSSLADLAKTGAEAIRVAFRLGVYVDEVSRKLESPQPDGRLLSWAHVVTGMTQAEVQKELDAFNARAGGADLTKVFISAADRTSVSVSGPPSRVLDAFQQSHALRYSKSLPLPVYDGLCHASHLYTEADIDFVINGSDPVVDPARPVRFALLSSQTGRRFEAQTTGSLFLEIGTELLTGTIYLDNVTAGILARTAQSGARLCNFDTFSTSLISTGIVSSIQASSEEVKVNKQNLMDWVNNDFGPRQPRSFRDSKLAIVGMACRMPGGANDTELFWQLMEQGRDVHTTVPEDRFDLKTHYDPTGKTENATQTPFGNFIDSPGLFDAGFFNMSPREAEQTDPMHRLALVTAYEALEMAGYVPNRTPSSNLGRIGTFYGQASDDWRELNASQNIGTYAVPGGERAFANGRINYFFKFGGPSFNVDTACSSGASAVNAGCSALWNGEADTVIAGGLNIITDPDNYAGLGNGHFLSKTGQCKVWDKGADGYCRADGIGSVVIKRLEDAEADNDNILAVVLAAATNHSAEAASITQPHAGAQKSNYKQVLQQAGANPLDVSYVELHGTGTQVGDAVESESVSDIFAPLSPRRRGDQRLHLGAVKCNIGHGEAAAGIASLLKVLLVYQKNLIPAHIGITTEINPIIPKDLDKRNVGLAMANTPWPRPEGKKRLAVVNSFGAHGGNTTMLLEDAPERKRSGQEGIRSTHVVAVTAKSKKSLRGNLQNLLLYLQENPETDLGDLSYTTCARRIQHNFRWASAVTSVAQLQKVVKSQLETGTDPSPVLLEAPSVIFTFTGQGAYYKGIAKELFEDMPSFCSQVTQLDRLVQRLGFPSVLPCIDGSVDDECPPLLTQLSIVVVEIALARLWLLLGVKPVAVVGHSLGEYAAMVAAGVVSAADAIFLVGRRAQLIDESCTLGSHVMLSVQASPQAIDDLVGPAGQDKYEVSCINGREDTVISGNKEDIEEIRKKIEANSIKCLLLDIPYAFHTAQMDPMLDSFEETASHVPFKAPSIPYLSPLLGTAVYDGKTVNASYLRRAAREPVDFAGAIEAAEDMGVADAKTVWVDIGPHPVCTAMVRKLVPAARVVASCRRNEDATATLAKGLAALHLAGVPLCWNEYFRSHEKSHVLLPLHKYAWNEVNYWIPYLGTWTLDKAHIKNGGRDASKADAGGISLTGASALRTSLVHQITSEEVDGQKAKLQTLSDVQHPDFLAAVQGHTMNDCGVATSSIWSDMALTVGEYLYRRVSSSKSEVHMSMTNFEVLHAQVAKRPKPGVVQLLALEANLDLSGNAMQLAWFNVSDSGVRAADSFASGTVSFTESPRTWLAEWERVRHLVEGRVAALAQMAASGEASRLNKTMAYALFKNVVDYAPKYRGMDSVVIHEHEAFADITLVPERHGVWHTPPHWIDSVSHLAGLVMNGSAASNTRDFFYVTPGCGSFRLAGRLEPGAKYRSYVRMFPHPEEANMYAGDVYIMNRDGAIVGMVGEIKFRRVPRLLMDKFFSPSVHAESHGSKNGASKPAATQRSLPVAAAPAVKAEEPAGKPTPQAGVVEEETPSPSISRTSSWDKLAPSTAASSVASDDGKADNAAAAGEGGQAGATEETGVVKECLSCIARETGLELGDLRDESTFVELGVDSLMSLVLSEKFRTELDLEVKSSIFLECSDIGSLKTWLEQYC